MGVVVFFGLLVVVGALISLAAYVGYSVGRDSQWSSVDD